MNIWDRKKAETVVQTICGIHPFTSTFHIFSLIIPLFIAIFAWNNGCILDVSHIMYAMQWHDMYLEIRIYSIKQYHWRIISDIPPHFLHSLGSNLSQTNVNIVYYSTSEQRFSWRMKQTKCNGLSWFFQL